MLYNTTPHRPHTPFRFHPLSQHFWSNSHPGSHVSVTCLSLASPSAWNNQFLVSFHDLDSCDEYILWVLPQCGSVQCSLQVRFRLCILVRNPTKTKWHSSQSFTAGAQDVSHWWCESWSPGHAGICQVSPPKRKTPIPLCRWEIFCGETLGGLSHYLPFLRSSLTSLGNDWLSPEFTTTVLIAQWCFLFPSFFHTFINWHCATRKSFSFPLIHLFIHSFTWPGLYLLLSLFTLMLKLSQIWKAPANCLLCPINAQLAFFEHFLTFLAHRIYWLVFTFLASALESVIAPRRAGFF